MVETAAPDSLEQVTSPPDVKLDTPPEEIPPDPRMTAHHELEESVTDQSSVPEGVSTPESEEGVLELQNQEGDTELKPIADSPTTSVPEPLMGPASNTRSAGKRLFSVMAPQSTVLPPSDTPTVGRALKSAQRQRSGMDRGHPSGTPELARRDIPAGAQILPCKIVLKLKRETTGQPNKYKARLCALGNLMRWLSLSCFPPTANDKSLKLLQS